MNASVLLDKKEEVEGTENINFPPIGLNFLFLKSRQLYGYVATPRKGETDLSSNIKVDLYLKPQGNLDKIAQSED